jgi:surfactin synthase thioesterase subunit
VTSGVASRLARLSPRSPAPRLLCVPHAGGRGESYRRWVSDAGEALEIWATELPGRLTDGEPPLRDPAAAIAAIASDAAALLDRPLAIFAHSMGALLAFEAVRTLERAGEAPTALFVSGCAAPHVPAARRPQPRTDEQLVALLRRWGGTPVSLLRDPELLALALPPLRADLALLDRYAPEPGVVSTPLTAFAGADDETASVEEVRQWSACTTRWRGLRVLPGGHFFLADARGAILDAIASAFVSG